MKRTPKDIEGEVISDLNNNIPYTKVAKKYGIGIATISRINDRIGREKYKKMLYISDLHVPYQDEKALYVFSKFFRWYNPDEVYIIGDLIDFYSLSRFDKNPSRLHRLQEEIDMARSILNMWRSFYKGKMWLLKGNHEHRLIKYIWGQAKQLSTLRSLELNKLLDLDKLDIRYIREGKIRRNNILVKHGNTIRKWSAYTAKAEQVLTGMSGISGHSHRLSQYYKTDERGTSKWVEVGCLCDLEPEYMEGKTANWQQGFGVGYENKKNSNIFNIEPVPIIDYHIVYQGYEFRV